MKRRRDRQDGAPKAGVPEGEVGRALRPAKIDIQWLILETPAKIRWEGSCRIPVEIPAWTIPTELAAGHNNQQLGYGPVGEPPVNLATDPGRARRLRGGQQEKKLGVAQRRFDRRPECGGGREAAHVTKNADCAQPVPRLCEPM